MSFFSYFSRVFSKNPVLTRHLAFSYDQQDVLRNITLQVKPSTITGIIGKSGSGKSTLLKIITGIISRRYAGVVRVFGKSHRWQKRRIGFVPQENALITDLSLEDNIRVMGQLYGVSEQAALKRSLEFLKLLKMNESLEKFPLELSGGQRVRVNIALSLLHDPSILILDEPFVGLDVSNRRILWHFLHHLKKRGKAIILSSHLLAETQDNVSRLVLLRNGRIFYSGKFEGLKRKLKLSYVFELRFHYLSKEALTSIQKFCEYRDIRIIDHYNKYMMFALNHGKNRQSLLSLFDRLSLSYEEIGFREPSIDEVFLAQ